VMVVAGRTRKPSGDDHHDIWILAHQLHRRDGIRHNHHRVRCRSRNSPDQFHGVDRNAHQ
jgi:hypothetical protein